MRGRFDRRLFCRFYPEADTFHNDFHSDLTNYRQTHLGVYPDLRTTTVRNLLLVSHNSPSTLSPIIGDHYLLPIFPSRSSQITQCLINSYAGLLSPACNTIAVRVRPD